MLGLIDQHTEQNQTINGVQFLQQIIIKYCSMVIMKSFMAYFLEYQNSEKKIYQKKINVFGHIVDI